MKAEAEAIAVLRAARALIGHPECWTQNDAAKDARGRWVPPNSTRAVCWCMLGAIERASHQLKSSFQAECLAQTLVSNVLRGSISIYNDTHTHKQVIGRFDRAIELAEARQ